MRQPRRKSTEQWSQTQETALPLQPQRKRSLHPRSCTPPSKPLRRWSNDDLVDEQQHDVSENCTFDDDELDELGSSYRIAQLSDLPAFDDDDIADDFSTLSSQHQQSSHHLLGRSYSVPSRLGSTDSFLLLNTAQKSSSEPENFQPPEVLVIAHDTTSTTSTTAPGEPPFTVSSSSRQRPHKSLENHPGRVAPEEGQQHQAGGASGSLRVGARWHSSPAVPELQRVKSSETMPAKPVRRKNEDSLSPVGPSKLDMITHLWKSPKGIASLLSPKSIRVAPSGAAAASQRRKLLTSAMKKPPLEMKQNGDDESAGALDKPRSSNNMFLKRIDDIPSAYGVALAQIHKSNHRSSIRSEQRPQVPQRQVSGGGDNTTKSTADEMPADAMDRQPFQQSRHTPYVVDLKSGPRDRPIRDSSESSISMGSFLFDLSEVSSLGYDELDSSISALQRSGRWHSTAELPTMQRVMSSEQMPMKPRRSFSSRKEAMLRSEKPAFEGSRRRASDTLIKPIRTVDHDLIHRGDSSEYPSGMYLAARGSRNAEFPAVKAGDASDPATRSVESLLALIKVGNIQLEPASSREAEDVKTIPADRNGIIKPTLSGDGSSVMEIISMVAGDSIAASDDSCAVGRDERKGLQRYLAA